MTSRVARGAVAIVVAIATLIGGYAIADSTRAGASTPLGPGLVTVTVDIRYSRFSMPTSTLHVRRGTTVRFLVRNRDPIAHEFVVGDRQVHLRHLRGTDPTHPPVPGEVSVAADDVGVTFYRFDDVGRYEFACHIPGHLAFGMRGWIIVDP
jgi:uncharacterized cupredoxin-like copper-binding protein